MNKKDIDVMISKISNLMQMMISIEKTLETSKNIKFKITLNREFESRLTQLRGECRNAVGIFDDWFKYEKENNLPIEFNYKAIQNQFKLFL